MLTNPSKQTEALDWPLGSYEKIADSLAEWIGNDEAAYRAANKVEWLVTEKIHGANFFVVTDGVTVRCAKRKAFLKVDEDFFGHRALLSTLQPKVLDLFAKLCLREPDTALAYVYGELFGGAYPHPDVVPVSGVQPVQTGCWYAPGIEFCAFDLGWVAAGASERVYFDFLDAMQLFDEVGIFCARPLLRGCYEDAAAFSPSFETTIPAALGLPSLGSQNKAEGVVLKPLRALTVPRRTGSVRPVIKHKIAEFSEDERFHRAEKWATITAPAPGLASLELLRHEASARVNENRLNAAVSKIGRIVAGDAVQLGEVHTLLIDDLNAELRANHASSLNALMAHELEDLERYVAAEAQALIDLYLASD